MTEGDAADLVALTISQAVEVRGSQLRYASAPPERTALRVLHVRLLDALVSVDELESAGLSFTGTRRALTVALLTTRAAIRTAEGKAAPA